MGAELVSGGVHFRVFAPKRKRVEVVIEGSGPHAPVRTVKLTRTAAHEGYFEGLCDGLRAGALYRSVSTTTRSSIPDPASRFQPEGPHGPSQCDRSDVVPAGPIKPGPA